MKKLLLSVLSLSTVALMAQIEGKWNCTFIGIGPTKGDFGWFSTGLNSTTRACMADDEYVFNSDGSFENVLGTETWLESWQGAAEGCGAPVAPHDGSNKGSWRYDATNGKLSIVGKGNFLGLAKVINGSELASSAAAADSIVYEVALNGNEMAVDISIKTGDGTPAYWRFTMVKQNTEIITDPKGDWTMTFIGVGPSKGDVSWYNTPIDPSNRPCLADDVYTFMEGGFFAQDLTTETWVEGWQGASADGCATPVAPHDGSELGSWKDNMDGTITISGKGSYLGLAKVINGGELAAPGDAPESITYEVVVNADTLVADIAIKTGDGTPAYWHFRFLRFVESASNNNINKNGITVYPNPANDVLWISNVELGAKVIVRSIDGRVVLNQTANGNAISVANLNQGTYLVEVHAQNGVATTKFIKN